MQFLRIVLLCVGAAVGYGEVHDQITAHLCVEYFSVAHPPIFHTDNPTLLAIGWGFIATWWVGMMLGVPLAAAARWGVVAKMDHGAAGAPGGYFDGRIGGGGGDQRLRRLEAGGGESVDAG
jgi:hypothetical protein